MKKLRDHILLHLDAGYNLARWLTRNDEDARDAVQDSFIRALKYGDGFKGADYRPWFLTIVRNTSYTLIKRRGSSQKFITFDEETHGINDKIENPEIQLLRSADVELVRKSLESLAVEYREVLILRELENLSYEEIAVIADIPLGTVMSRLSRGRTQLAELIKGSAHEDK